MKPRSRRPWRPTKDQIGWTCVLLIAVFVGINFWAFGASDSADAAQIDPTPTIEVTATSSVTPTPGIPGVTVWHNATEGVYLAFSYEGPENIFANMKAEGNARGYTWTIGGGVSNSGGPGFTLHALEGPLGPVVQPGDTITVTITFLDGQSFEPIGEKTFTLQLLGRQANLVSPFGIVDADPNNLQNVYWHRIARTWVDCESEGVQKALLANKTEELQVWALNALFDEGEPDQYAPPGVFSPEESHEWTHNEFSRLRGKHAKVALYTAADDYRSVATWEWRFDMPLCESLVTVTPGPSPTSEPSATPTPTPTPNKGAVKVWVDTNQAQDAHFASDLRAITLVSWFNGKTLPPLTVELDTNRDVPTAGSRLDLFTLFGSEVKPKSGDSGEIWVLIWPENISQPNKKDVWKVGPNGIEIIDQTGLPPIQQTFVFSDAIQEFAFFPRRNEDRVEQVSPPEQAPLALNPLHINLDCKGFDVTGASGNWTAGVRNLRTGESISADTHNANHPWTSTEMDGLTGQPLLDLSYRLRTGNLTETVASLHFGFASCRLYLPSLLRAPEQQNTVPGRTPVPIPTASSTPTSVVIGGTNEPNPPNCVSGTCTPTPTKTPTPTSPSTNVQAMTPTPVRLANATDSPPDRETTPPAQDPAATATLVPAH